MPADKCKLPAYMPHNPLVWFKVVEANFNVHKVVDDGIRCSLVLAALPEKQVEACSSVIRDEYNYAELKKKLLTVDGLTFQQSWEIAMAIPALSPGQKPSDIHRQMTAWIPEDDAVTADSPVVRATFLSKMPDDVKKMLLQHEDKNLAQLTALADSIVSTSVPSSSPRVSVLQAAEDHVDAPVCALTPRANPRPPVPWKPKPRPPRPNPPAPPPSPAKKAGSIPTPSGSPYCWYHASFGDLARSCKPGCTWPGNATRPVA